ncbi:glycosyltransferase family 4 protein [Pseudenterobacter timonensis]|uniref:Glycosyltransferase family 4 protein n=1 Tax=Pseudenterobacter timonensis TaxID=1755099 RepID=A0AAE4ITB3_9ENTR|nr:glycosyltransferase family 4 protein [Pseudenterobacter timonensis]MDR9888880.1 glycosyltransferase family 4 protein [Pseudenterobacter timonensis]
MKIAHVQVIPKLSGVQQITLDILSGLDRNSKCAGEITDKTVICGEIFDNDFVELFSVQGIKIISIPSLKREIGLHDVKCFFELYKLFRNEQYNIVHTNSTKPGIIARIAAKCAGTKRVIHTVHGIAFHAHANIISRLIFYILENIATLFGDVNITVNKLYTKYYPFVKSKVIYNGVDFEKLTPVKNTKINEMHFAFFGRLDEQKNPLEFIKAVKIVLNTYSGPIKPKFTLAGDGELRNKCCQMVADFNLQDKIYMPGWINDKSKFLNEVDVLCQPSKWEAFGLVFVEAAYFGIPSIATNVEGIPEVVLPSETGILYDGGAEALAACMLSYLTDRQLLAEHGINAKKYVTQNFTKEKMVSEYCSVYFEK